MSFLARIDFAFVLVQSIRRVIEDAETTGHFRSGAADADIEPQLAQAIRDQIFDQHDSLARLQNTLDLFRAAVTFGLFPDIDHRLFEQMRNKRGVGMPAVCAAGEQRRSCRVRYRSRLFSQCRDDVFALRRERQKFAAVDINRRNAAGRQTRRVCPYRPRWTPVDSSISATFLETSTHGEYLSTCGIGWL